MKALSAFLIAIFALLGLGRPAAAAPVTSLHASSELIARTVGAAPGSTLWVAVVQTLDKGWHTYWRNPGDAGEPTTVKWTLPGGWRADDITWPTPERLPVGPIMNYGFEGQVVLPVALHVPANARVGDTVQLSAVVEYLVCAEVCVPGTVNLSLATPVVAGTPAADPRGETLIAGALAKAPQTADLTATFQAAGPRVTLAVAGSALNGPGAHEVYFYPYAGDALDHAKPQTLDRGPRGLTLALSGGSAFTGLKPPETLAGVLAVDGRAYEVAAKAGPAPAGAAGLGPPTAAAARAADTGGVWGAMLAAFLGGLILNLMPCVFPILSMKAATLAGHAGEVRAARSQAFAFLAGVLASFLGLAALLVAARAGGAAVGWGFQLQSPPAVALLALVMLAAALNLSGLFEIGTSAQGLGAELAARGGLTGAAFTGVLAVVVAAPCTAPFMGPALGFALTQPPLVTGAVFLALGLGFAAPFVLFSLSPALIRRLPRPGAWMDLIRKGLAFPMYAAAAWLAWVLARQGGPDGLARLLAAGLALALAAWLFGLGQRRGATHPGPGALALSGGAAVALAGAVALVSLGAYAAPTEAGASGPTAKADLPSEPWSEEKLAALRAAGRPVFVNFTAAWCVTCQVNERVAFSGGQVAEALRRDGAAYLVADWTNRDGAIAQALARQGRVGVPLYLVYGADGGEPKVLPQFLTPGIVARALDAAARPAGQPAG